MSVTEVAAWWLDVEKVADPIGKRLERNVGTCPECGGPTEVDRRGNWRCLSIERRAGVRVYVCAARGRVIEGDAVTTVGSNNLWRAL